MGDSGWDWSPQKRTRTRDKERHHFVGFELDVGGIVSTPREPMNNEAMRTSFDDAGWFQKKNKIPTVVRVSTPVNLGF
jgi:hypothetical protein